MKVEGVIGFFGATLNSLNLDSKKTALVIIDLQNAIVGMNTAPHPAAQIVENSKRLAQPFRATGAPVVYVRLDLNHLLNFPAHQPPNMAHNPNPPITSAL